LGLASSAPASGSEAGTTGEWSEAGAAWDTYSTESTFGILANIMVRSMLSHRQLKKNQDQNEK
jgi:hypothetical protein